MKEKEIFEQFLNVSGVPEDDIVDYRFCTKFYAGIYIPNSILRGLPSPEQSIIRFPFADFPTDIAE